MEQLGTELQRLIEALSIATIDRHKRLLEKQMRRLIVKRFRKQWKRLAQKLLPFLQDDFREAEPGGSILESLILQLLQEDAALFETAIQVIYIAALQKAFEATSGEMGVEIDFELPTTRIENILGQRAAAMITAIDEATRDIVHEMIVTGHAERKSYAELASELRARFVEFGALKPQRHIRDRATLIAVTEIGEAYGEGQIELGREMEKSGLTMEKSWLTVGDDRVTANCRFNQSEGWIPLAKAFSSGHQRPLRFPGCRCALQLRRAA